MEVETVKNQILILEEVFIKIIEYMKANKLSNKTELENHLEKNFDENIWDIYLKYQSEKLNFDELHSNIKNIKSQKAFKDYGMSKEEVDELIILITKSNYELEISHNVEVNQDREENKTNEIQIQLDHSLKIQNVEENSIEIQNEENLKFYTYETIEEIKELPESFIKYLKFLEYFINEIHSKSQNPFEDNSNMEQQKNLLKEKWNMFEEFYIKNNLAQFDGVEKLKKSLKSGISIVPSIYF